jgi:hypothetical protein
MKHPGLRLAVGLFVLVLLVAVAGGIWVWIKMAALKDQLAANLGAALGAQVVVTSLQLDLWKGEVHAAGITLTNQRPEAPWDHGAISQATVHFHLRDLFAPTMPLSVEVGSWSVVLHSPTAGAASAAGSGPELASAPAAPAPPSRVRVTHLSAQDGDVELDLAVDRKVLFHGVSFDADNDAAVSHWTTHLQADSITAGLLQLGASSVELRSEPGQISFSSLRLPCAQGMITGEGEVALGDVHETRVTLKAVDVPVTMLVSAEWQMKLSGLATGDLAYHSDDRGAAAHGQVALTGAKFNVLPFLGKMTSMIGLPDISGVEVDKATSDFSWQNGVLHLTQIDIRKNDVTRIAGQVDVDAATNQVDGHLKLGLPASALSRWAPLQANVFPESSDDYDWAEVHLTGTPDHLQEDLSSRVLAQGVEAGGSLLNQGTQKAADLLKSFLGP